MHQDSNHLKNNNNNVHYRNNYGFSLGIFFTFVLIYVLIGIHNKQAKSCLFLLC
jgi:hypothetical protein